MARTQQTKKVGGTTSRVRKQPAPKKAIPPKIIAPSTAKPTRTFRPSAETRTRRRIMEYQKKPKPVFLNAPFQRYVRKYISSDLTNGSYGIKENNLKTEGKIYALLGDATVKVLTNLLNPSVIIAASNHRATVKEEHFRAARHSRNVPWDQNMGEESALTWLTTTVPGTFGSSKPKKKKRSSRAKNVQQKTVVVKVKGPKNGKAVVDVPNARKKKTQIVAIKEPVVSSDDNISSEEFDDDSNLLQDDDGSDSDSDSVVEFDDDEDDDNLDLPSDEEIDDSSDDDDDGEEEVYFDL